MAFLAVGFHHFFVRSDEKFQLMAVKTFVFLLQFSSMEFIRRNKWANNIVSIKLFQGTDEERTFCWRIWTKEFQSYVRNLLNKKRRAAL